MSLTEIFCDVDDFCQEFLRKWEQSLLEVCNKPEEQEKRKRKFTLSPSEVMTIVIYFHQSGYRNLKRFYLKQVSVFLRDAFPHLVSYNRFVELMQSVLIPLCAYLHSRKGKSKGIAFIDSMPIRVCHNRRINRHRTFKGVAQRGKNSVDWFYGFKLHLVVNDCGELIRFFCHQWQCW